VRFGTGRILLACLAAAALTAADTKPAAWWTFDDVSGTAVRDRVSGTADAVSGNFGFAEGVDGKALKFDGYTTVVTRKAADAPAIGDGFTIEAWVALAAYPWNWTPIVDQSDERVRGYAFEIGPRGQLRARAAIDGRWLEATSRDFELSLRRWTHVSARYDPATGLTVFAGGAVAGTALLDTEPAPRTRRMATRVTPARDLDLLIGAVRTPERASNWHRFDGTRPSWFSLDGLLDDVKIYTAPLAPDAITADAARTPKPPTLAPRVLPSGPDGPGKFGAYLTTLHYYPEWDALWRMGADADILVRFDTSPVRLVFWRGTQYSPAWVTDNHLWMSDQSVEGYVEGYTYEHMNDKQNRYSHVRLIEQTDARVVVHWRYALVNVKNELWNVSPRLGNGAWIDEYYYVYPDATAVRHVTWPHDTLGHPIQFQESIVITQPGQLEGDVIEPRYATVGNLNGDTGTLEFVDNPAGRPPKTFPSNLSIQMHHFKSRYKPFIVFEPGDRMGSLRDLDTHALSQPASSDHWPVAQIWSDGRTGQAADRAGHFLGFPISDPPLHEGVDGRDFWNGLYGMTDRPFTDLVMFARSWETPPMAKLSARGYTSEGYDSSERAYNVTRHEDAGNVPLRMTLAASSTSPVRNVALVVTNWGNHGATLVADGQPVVRGPRFRYGYRYTLQGTDLVVWIEASTERPLSIELTPVPQH